MIERKAAKELINLASQYKAVAVTGPRQSGKTTLVKFVFSNKPYVSLENPDMRSFAADDPRGFLASYPGGAVLDEVQRVPALFSYLQQVLDDRNEAGYFILTGSNNFLLQENIRKAWRGGSHTLIYCLFLCRNWVWRRAATLMILFLGECTRPCMINLLRSISGI